MAEVNHQESYWLNRIKFHEREIHICERELRELQNKKQTEAADAPVEMS